MNGSKKKEGFTLVEILVTMGITILLSTAILTYSGSGRAQVALSFETAKLAQVITRAKSLTLSTYATGAAECGYGVRFDIPGRRYELVSWKDTFCDRMLGTPEVTVIETENLPPALAYGEGAGQISGVYFIPPDPKTMLDIGGSIFADRTGYIYLKTQDGLLEKPVSVSSAGQINF